MIVFIFVKNTIVILKNDGVFDVCQHMTTPDPRELQSKRKPVR